MSVTIREKFELNDVLTDVTLVELSDGGSPAKGVIRNDTGASVVAAGTEIVKVSTGVYEYTFNEPAADLIYTIYTKYIWDGQEYFKTRTFNAAESESTLCEVMKQLKDDFENDVTLAAYIKQVLLGTRENIAEFPCIIIDPVRIRFLLESYPSQDYIADIIIIGYARIHDKDSQFTGVDGEVTGLLDIENDVRNVLMSDRSVDCKILDLKITEVGYDFAEYPVRSFAMRVECQYRKLTT